MESNTFCVLPWLHAATLTDGSVQLCCVAGESSKVNLNSQTLDDYWNSDYVKDARRRMLAGEQVAACARCYKGEAHGYKSHRQVENQVWQKRLGKEVVHSLVATTKVDGSVDTPLRYIDLRLGNTCNMKCIMCQPRESSRWLLAARKIAALAEDRELKSQWQARSAIDVRRFEWYRNEAFWSNLESWLPDVNEIILAGGEPFLISEQFEFVKACCELGEAHHIRLRYHTNGTVFPRGMVPYWKQFEHVNFFVSIDSIGAAANYLRYPTDWQAIEENIRDFDGVGENTLTNFHFTAHALNVYRIPEVMRWADTSGFKNRTRFRNLQDYLCLSLVYDPAYQDVRVLPENYKRIVTRALERYRLQSLCGQRTEQIDSILEFMNSSDESTRLPTLVEYTRLLDSSRGTDFSSVFPELVPYWNPRLPANHIGATSSP